jgi:multisubunit Na+/H+ antiporter MnhG subunit
MVLGSCTALGLMGHVIGVIAILCVVGAAGAVYAYLLLAVAVSYQLYLFSRHPFYEQIVEAAYADELETEEEDGKRDKSAKANRRK